VSLVSSLPSSGTRVFSLPFNSCRSFVFITLQIPLPATPFLSYPYKTPGVSPLPCFLKDLARRCVSYLCRKPRVLSGLPPVYLSLPSFPRSFPLFSSICSLFAKIPGGNSFSTCGPFSFPTCRRSAIPCSVLQMRLVHPRKCLRDVPTFRHNAKIHPTPL
jgi:hypothetical protein